MDNYITFVHKRNVFVVKLLWILLLLDGFLSTMTRNHSVMDIVLGLILLSGTSLLVGQKKNPVVMMYFITTCIFVFLFILIQFDPHYVNVLYIWIGLIFTAFYYNSPVILLGLIYSIALTIYSLMVYNKDILTITSIEDAVFMISFNIFIAAMLLLYNRIANQLWKDAEANQQKLTNILDNVDIVTWSLEMDSQRMIISDKIQTITGISAKRFYEEKDLWMKIIHPDDQAAVQRAYKKLMEGEVQLLEYRFINQEGKVCWIQNRGIPIKNHLGEIAGLDGIVLEITQRKEMEEQIKHMAYHDALTGLPNRCYFNNQFKIALDWAKQTGQKLGVLFMDLDNFKEVNDTLGHDVGDELLIMVAQELRKIFRDRDMICRMGGDEFLILLENITDEQLDPIVQRAVEECNRPLHLDGHTIKVDYSIGISIYPDHGEDLETLLQKADRAMYTAKRNGGMQYKVSNEEGI